MTRTSSATTTVPINELVNRALTLLEQFKTSQNPAERSTIHTEVKSILNKQIPQHPRYVEFVNRNSVFYESFVDMQAIVKHHEAIVLESRFQSIRRNSHSVQTRTSSLRNLEVARSHARKTSELSNPPESLAKPAKTDLALPYPASPTKNTRKMVMPEPQNAKLVGPPAVLEISPKVLASKLHVSQVLLIDLRSRSQFEAKHIRCPLITNFEPASVRYNMSDYDLQDSLVISDPQEFDSFGQRAEVDLICVYDEHSARISDSEPLQTLSGVLRASQLNHCILSGGFAAWEQTYPQNTVGTASQLSFSDSQLEETPPLPIAPPPPVPPYPKNIPRLPPKVPSFQPSPPHESSANAFLQPKSGKTHTELDLSALNYPVAYPTPKLTPPKLSPPKLTSPRLTPSKIPSPKLTPSKVSPSKLPPSKLPPSKLPPSKLPPSKLPPSKVTSKPDHFIDTSRKLKDLEPSRSANQNQALNGYMDIPAKTTLPSLRVPRILSASNDANGSYTTSPNHSGENLTKRSPDLAPIKSLSSIPAPPYTEEEVPPHLVSTTGLKNLGNTCYMNCIIQCLTAFPQFVCSFYDGSFMRHINYNSRIGHKGQFSYVFAELVRNILNGSAQTGCPVLAPVMLKQVAGNLRPYDFAGYEQQDCQEFLTFVLDELHEDLNSNGDKPKQGELNEFQEKAREQMGIRAASAIEWERYLEGDTSLIVDMFQGQYLSRLQCLTCRHTSTTYNAFSTLSLPIVSTKLLSQHSTLKACFEEFVKPEILNGDNAWFCPHCQAKRRTVKTLQISRLPPILVIHLKRFKRSSSGVIKLETPVDYPVRGLDLTRYWPQLRHHELGSKEAEILASIPSRGQEPPFIYDLRAVTLHSGTLKGGHYTAVVQKPHRGWLYFDDANVYPVKEPAAVSKNAYVLFYRRRML